MTLQSFPRTAAYLHIMYRHEVNQLWSHQAFQSQQSQPSSFSPVAVHSPFCVCRQWTQIWEIPQHVSSNYGNDSAQTWKQDREMAVDKKLAKKLAKMSEEDRAIFLEQQRLAEEENQRKKEEMLSRFLKVGGVCQNQSLT